MQALVFDGTLHVDFAHPEPVLRAGEAIIAPHLVGICNTDLEITRGYKSFHGVLGHEFVGTVIACEAQGWVGKRVVGEINAACGQCRVCLAGAREHCPERTTLGIYRRNGVMAERFSLPIDCLHPVPHTVSDDAAVFAEPLAAALAIIEQTHIRPTERIAVVGDGKLGLLCAQVLRLGGNDVVTIGRHPERCTWLEQLGIVARTAVMHEDRGRFDLVVECTGNPSGLELARELLRPRGRLVLKSTIAATSTINLTQLVVDEIQVVGSRCGPFAPALRLLERGLIQTEPLIAERRPLRDGVAAFAAAPRRLKMLLEV